MKSILNTVLSFGTLMLACFGAMQNDAPMKNLTLEPPMIGWVQSPDGLHCQQRTVNCSTTNNGQLCMADNGTKQVFAKSAAGQCTVILYKDNQ